MSQSNPLDKLPYRARFTSTAAVVSPKAFEKKEAFASLSALETYIPKEVMVDGNIDLLYVAFNGTVVNQFNENGDGISAETAAKIMPRFANKQINLQHDRSDIVGHTFRAGFATLEDSTPMSIEEAIKIQDPINLSVSGAIYKVVNPKLISLLRESSDPDNDLYHVISTSWEIAFSEYVIALGSKNLKDAELITDPEEIEEYSKYLKGEKSYEWESGGKGVLPDGTPVFRLIVGDDVLPTGFGLTTIPAAAVKGIHVVDDDIELDDNDDGIAQKASNSPIIENKCSIKSEVAVNQNETNLNKAQMDIDTIKKTLEEVLASNKKDTDNSKEVVANVIDAVQEALKDANSLYSQEVEKERKAAEDARASEETLKSQLDETKEVLAGVQKELEDLKEDARKTAIAETFSARMAKIDEEYELNDEDRTAIASQIRELSDEGFEAWSVTFARFAEAKSKAFIEARNNELTKAVEAAKLEAVASKEDEDVEDVLDGVVASEDSDIPNAADTDSEPSLVDRMSANLKDHIQIS